MATPVLGMSGKLYYNKGTYGAPNWAEITNVRDVSLTIERDEADVTTRANNGWRATLPTLKSLTIEFEMVWLPGDDGFDVLREAFDSGNTVDILVTDTGSTGYGWRAQCRVSRFNVTQPLEEAQKVSVALKPTLGVAAPTWWQPAPSSSGT